jgi:hypothetical protein
LKKIIRKTVPFITAAALLAVPAYQTADFFMTDISSAEYTAEVGDEIIIEIGEVTGEAGTKVKLPVYAKNVGVGFSALQFDYEMDSSFRITRGLKGDFACSWTIGKSERTVQFLEGDGMNISEGKIGRLEIDIPAGTPDGVYEVSCSHFEGSKVGESGAQERLKDDDFTGVSGKIIIGSGESGNNDPEPSPSPEASPSNEAAPSPSAAASPSVKPSPSVKASPSAKTSPSAKATADASPSAKTSASPAVKTSASAKASSSPDQNASSDPDAAKTASPVASDDPSAEKTASPDGNNAAVSDENGAVNQENVIVVTDAEGNEVTLEVTDSKADAVTPEETKVSEPPLSKKVRTGVLIGSAIAILLVLLLVFRRD